MRGNYFLFFSMGCTINKVFRLFCVCLFVFLFFLVIPPFTSLIYFSLSTLLVSILYSYF
ncbi:unnamed protein product [Meloidogyne enterolobii]|uniref:Uncharacterized protein n=1 Tax=Meloidogyne enterolobii TaxID=390850 RepID=A0ACB0YL76_MELEN